MLWRHALCYDAILYLLWASVDDAMISAGIFSLIIPAYSADVFYGWFEGAVNKGDGRVIGSSADSCDGEVN